MSSLKKAEKTKQDENWRKRNKNFYYSLLWPAIILLTLITIVPILYVIGTSLTDWDLTRPESLRFIGLENYLSLLFDDPRFWNSILVQLKLSLYTVPLQIILGLLVALFIKHRFQKSWIVELARSTFIIPMVIPPIVAAVIWKILFTPPVSILNYFVTGIGFGELNWLGNPDLALVAIAIAQIWEFFPFCFLLFYATLISLPEEPFEAAQVDGASFLQGFRYITMPMILPTTSVVFLFRLVDSLKSFPMIYVMTEGGPGFVTEPPNYYAFVMAFSYSRVGYSSSMIVILFILSMLITFFLIRNIPWTRGEM
jgi:multiple sugar transport system permease protein